MSNPTHQEIEQARALTTEITTRARGDQAYMKQLVEDPVGTLLAAGLPPGAVVDVLAEEGVEEGEVQGFIAGLGSRPGISPSLIGGFGALPGGGFADGCSGAFSCLCASGGGCCFTGKGSDPGTNRGTITSPRPF